MPLNVGTLYASMELHDAAFKAQLKSIQSLADNITRQISRGMASNIKAGLATLKSETDKTSKDIANSVLRNMGNIAPGMQKTFQGFKAATNWDISLGPLNSMTTGFNAMGIASGLAFSIAADGIKAVVGGLEAALRVGSDFEAQMSAVAAVAFDLDTLNTDVGQAAFAALEEQAIELGSSTVFTAKQVGEAQELLARAGFNVNEIMSATPGVLSAAAAEGLSLARTADIAGNALRGFRLDASEMTMVADLLAKTSATSNASIESLGQAFKYVAPVASTVSLDIKEASAAIGLLANVGLQGTMAGRNLASGLMFLVTPSKKAKKVMEEYNIAILDAKGNFKDLPNIFKELEKATIGVSEGQALANIAMIVGKDNAKTYLALLKSQYRTMENGKEVVLTGSDALRVYSEALNGSAGAAEQMANIRLDNLKGDMERLRGEADALGIALFKQASPALRGLAQAGTAALEKLSPLIVSVFGKIVATVQNITKNALPGFKQAWANLKPAIQQLAPIVSRALGILAGLVTQAAQWGGKIVAALAKGMAMAVGPIVKVLQFIGGIIKYWLKPNSPPRIAPELDDWGRDTAQLYVDSFGKADIKTAFVELGNEIKSNLGNTSEDVMSLAEMLGQGISERIARGMGNWTLDDFQMFEDLTSQVEETIRGLAESGDIAQDAMVPAIQASRDAIQNVVDDIRQFGNVSDESIRKVLSSMGTTSPEVEGLVRSYAALKKASQDVAKAQERLNRVTEEYNQKLQPLNDQMAAIQKEKQRIEDMKRIEELQKDLKEGKLDENEAALAQLEIDEIRLRQQIDAIEEEKEKAVTAEEDKVKAAEAAQKAAEDDLKLKQSQIDNTQEQNKLIGEQIKILEELKRAQEEAAKAAERAKKDETGGGGGVEPLLGAGFDPEEMVFPVPEDFTDLTSALGDIKKTVEEVTGKVDDFQKGFADARNEITLFVDGIRDNTALQTFKDNVGFVKDKITETGDYLKTTFNPAITVLSSIIKTEGIPTFQLWASEMQRIWEEEIGPTWQTIKDNLGDLGRVMQGLKEPIMGFITLIGVTLYLALQSFMGLTQGQLPGAFEKLRGTMNVLSGTVETVVGLITGYGKALARLITGDIGGAAKELEEMSKTLEVSVPKIFDGLFSLVLGSTQTWVGGMAGQWDFLYTAITGKSSNLAVEVNKEFEKIRDNPLDRLRELFLDGGKILWDLSTGWMEPIFTFMGSVKDEFLKINGYAQTAFEGAMDWLYNAVDGENFLKTIARIGYGFLDMWKIAFGWENIKGYVDQLLANLPDWLRQLLGLSPLKTPQGAGRTGGGYGDDVYGPVAPPTPPMRNTVPTGSNNGGSSPNNRRPGQPQAQTTTTNNYNNTYNVTQNGIPNTKNAADEVKILEMLRQ